MTEPGLPPPPDAVARRFHQLDGRRRSLAEEDAQCARELEAVEAWLALEPQITGALQSLSRDLFVQITQLLEEKLTIALREVLEQPLTLRVKPDFNGVNPTIEFSVERDGNSENILKGMGGSVANVLSVGLRLFALTTLDETRHRRFLVLDEQDCWIRPDIVPRFVKIIQQAGRALGFQVLMISHHDASIFHEYADRIIRLEPKEGRVGARVLFTRDEQNRDGSV